MNQERKKLKEILNTVEKHNNPEVGLFSGSAGELLFLANYHRIFKDEKSKKIFNHKIESTYSILNSSQVKYNFCSGLAGLGWTLNLLEEDNLAEYDLSEFSETFDELIFKSAIRDIKRNYYDYLHGGFGTVLYAIDQRNKTISNELLPDLVDEMLKKARVTDDHCYWIDSNFLTSLDDTKDNINLGYAHGNTGIINLLIEVYNHTRDEKILEPIKKGINLLLSSEIEDSVSLYPSQIGSSNKSRLGWCYGDVGFALTILKAAKLFDNSDWSEQAYRIAKKCALRQDLSENVIVDAGICHGSTGLELFFDKFYKETGDSLFQKTATYWNKVTKTFDKFSDGAAGYKKFTQYGWEADKNLLSGITGIGLVMLSQLEDTGLNWERSLLYN